MEGGRRRYVLELLVSLGLVALLFTGAASAQPKVEVRGLRIVGDGYGEFMGGVRPFNWTKGVSLALLVTIPDGGLIAFDKDAGKVKALVDDKGTDLLPGKKYGKPGFGMMNSISKDGKACMVELEGGTLPAKGAKEIRASGTMVFKTGTKKQTFKQANVPLKAGTAVKAGPIPFTIKSAGKPQWGNQPLQITFKTHQKLDRVAEWKFYDAAGKEIKSSHGGTTTMSAFGKMNIDKSFNLAQKVDKVTIAITYWMDMKTVSVPFDLKVSMGL